MIDQLEKSMDKKNTAMTALINFLTAIAKNLPQALRDKITDFTTKWDSGNFDRIDVTAVQTMTTELVVFLQGYQSSGKSVPADQDNTKTSDGDSGATKNSTPPLPPPPPPPPPPKPDEDGDKKNLKSKNALSQKKIQQRIQLTSKIRIWTP